MYLSTLCYVSFVKLMFHCYVLIFDMICSWMRWWWICTSYCNDWVIKKNALNRVITACVYCRLEGQGSVLFIIKMWSQVRGITIDNSGKENNQQFNFLSINITLMEFWPIFRKGMCCFSSHLTLDYCLGFLNQLKTETETSSQIERLQLCVLKLFIKNK